MFTGDVWVSSPDGQESAAVLASRRSHQSPQVESNYDVVVGLGSL